MAEGVGFEPTVGCPTLDFESSALNRTQPPFRSWKTSNIEHRMQIGSAAKQISTRINRGRILGGMKASHLISFVCGLMLVIGFNTLRGSNTESSQHVYELRLYHVNPGKMNELRDRFGN